MDYLETIVDNISYVISETVDICRKVTSNVDIYECTKDVYDKVYYVCCESIECLDVIIGNILNPRNIRESVDAIIYRILVVGYSSQGILLGIRCLLGYELPETETICWALSIPTIAAYLTMIGGAIIDRSCRELLFYHLDVAAANAPSLESLEELRRYREERSSQKDRQYELALSSWRMFDKRPSTKPVR